MQNEELSVLSRRMFDGYGFSDVVGTRYFDRFTNELARFRFREVFEHHLRTYPSRYVMDFVMAAPALWRNQPTSVWVEVLTRTDGRPDPSKARDAMGSYADIELLSRYVGVDALRFVVESAEVRNPDKANVLRYFYRFMHSLVPSELDTEGMDGEYFASIEEVRSLRARLCQEQGFQPFDATDSSIEPYFKALLASSGLEGLMPKSIAV